MWLGSRSEGARHKRAAETAAQLAPVQADLQLIHAKLDTGSDNSSVALRAAIHDALDPIRNQLAILDTKVEPLWTALINMGINQVNVLHQPDPRRTEVDGLLEKLKVELSDGQLMSVNDFVKLRRFLELIKNWEPGADLGFPVLPAEPTSAAVLLAIMGLNRTRRNQE